MKVHANTTRDEFVDFLYYALADANFGPLVLDQVEHLRGFTDLEAEIERKDEVLNDMEKDRDDLEAELTELVDGVQAIADDIDPDDETADKLWKRLDRALEIARKALKRHKNDKYDV